MPSTMRQTAPNLAELMELLPNCTGDDIDEIVRFLKILHRGREQNNGNQNGQQNNNMNQMNQNMNPNQMAMMSSKNGGPFGGNLSAAAAGKMMNSHKGGHGGGPYGGGYGTSGSGGKKGGNSGGVLSIPPGVSVTEMLASKGNNNTSNDGTSTSGSNINNNSTSSHKLKRSSPPGGPQPLAIRESQQPPVQNPSQDYDYYGREVEQATVLEIEQLLSCAGNTPSEAKAAFQIVFENPKYYQTVFAIFGKVCRNCFLSGIGYQNTPRHTVAECKSMGNPCWVECRICNDGSCHWIDDCPSKTGCRTE